VKVDDKKIVPVSKPEAKTPETTADPSKAKDAIKSKKKSSSSSSSSSSKKKASQKKPESQLKVDPAATKKDKKKSSFSSSSSSLKKQTVPGIQVQSSKFSKPEEKQKSPGKIPTYKADVKIPITLKPAAKP
jgi:hypothetical protein